MTERLFEKDPYIREFDARVVECIEDGDKYLVQLDRTAFFPEGGGQPGDRGYLGKAVVFDTHEKEGCIWHQTDSPLAIGDKIYGILDWNFRYSNMQNHAGEHIVSGLIHQKYGFDNVGFHMGSDGITLDINGELTKEQVEAIEEEANRAVQDNIPIQVTIPAKDVLKQMDYRSKKALEGDVRIVEIPGIDVCACCGTHPLKTGEIHLIKILSLQNYKGGVRILMVAGMRALADYAGKHESIIEISHLLSAKTGEVCEAVSRLQKENADLKFRLVRMKKELLAVKAENFGADKDVICVQEPDLNGNELREYANLLIQKAKRVLVLSDGGDDRWRYVLADGNGKAKELGAEIQTLFDGKGGGSPAMIQGTMTGTFKDIQQWIETHL